MIYAYRREMSTYSASPNLRALVRIRMLRNTLVRDFLWKSFPQCYSLTSVHFTIDSVDQRQTADVSAIIKKIEDLHLEDITPEPLVVT